MLCLAITSGFANPCARGRRSRFIPPAGNSGTGKPHVDLGLGFVPLSGTGSALRFEGVGHGYEFGSILATTNPPFDEWSWGDSNPLPPACKAGALPDELQPRIGVWQR